MAEQDQRISEVVKREQSRLRNFIRRQVPDPADVEDILQDVFYKLVEANRLLMPIDHVTGWLFSVARNRITDLFRKSRRRKRPSPRQRGGRKLTTCATQQKKVAICCRSKIFYHRLMPGRRRCTFAACCLMSWNLRSTHCPTSSAKYSSLTNWRGAASRSCRQKAASTSTRCSRASAMQ